MFAGSFLVLALSIQSCLSLRFRPEDEKCSALPDGPEFFRQHVHVSTCEKFGPDSGMFQRSIATYRVSPQKDNLYIFPDSAFFKLISSKPADRRIRCCSNDRSPDFISSGASKSVDQRIKYSLGTSCDGFWSSKIVKGLVGLEGL